MTDSLDLDSLALHQERLRRLARALTGSESEAEDLVQDAWVKALENGPREPRALGAWLATVVRRLAGNERRGGERRRRRERTVAHPEALPSSVEIAARVDVQKRLLEAVEALDEPHRSLLRDRYLGDLTSEQIAQREGLTLVAVHSRLKRARAALRTRLERDGLGEEAHWTIALAPLVLGSQRNLPWASVTEPLVHSASTVASSTAAAPALFSLPWLVGSALVMKKTLAGLVVLTACLLAWRIVDRGPMAEPERTGPAEAQEPGAALVVPSLQEAAADSGSESARAPVTTSVDRLSTGRDFEIRGRFRDPTGHGVPLTDFVLAMYAGMEIDGEPLQRFDLQTGPGGRFSLELERPACSVSFDIEIEDHPEREYATYAPYRAPLGEAPPELDVLVFVRDAVLKGQVTDREGQPVEGAQVEGMSGEAMTARDGRFEMAIASGRFGQLSAWAEGHGLVEAYLEQIEPGSSAHIDLQLPDEVKVTGVVRDTLGLPIRNAKVLVHGHPQWETHTDGQGRFTISSLVYEPGKQLRVHASSEVHLSEFHALTLAQDQFEIACEFELESGVRVTGALLDPDGGPILGAEVWTGWDSMAWDRNVTYTDDEGRFVLDRARTGATRIGANASHWPALDLEVELTANQHVTLVVERPRSAQGTVRDSAGEPVAGLSVAALRNSTYLQATDVTDGDGFFELHGLPSRGPLTLEAYGVGWVRTTERIPETAFSASPEEFVITVQRAGRLRGRVVDAETGLPVSDFTIRIGWPSWPDERPAEAQSIRGISSAWYDPGKTFQSAEGRWSTQPEEELTPGAWAHIHASAPGYAGLRIDPVQVQSMDDPNELDIRLARPIAVDLNLTCGGDPIADAIVLATRTSSPSSADERWNVRPGAAGVAHLPGMSPGPLYLRVQRLGRADWLAGPFDVSPTNSAFWIDVPSGHPLEVIALDAQGRPRSEVQIGLQAQSAAGSTDQHLIATTNASGLVRFEGLPEGRWWIGTAMGTETRLQLDDRREITLPLEPSVRSITLQPSGQTEVTVRFEGSPAPPNGAIAQFLSESGPVRIGRLADGVVQLDGVRPGTYTVQGFFWAEAQGKSMKLTGQFEVPQDSGSVETLGRIEANP